MSRNLTILITVCCVAMTTGCRTVKTRPPIVALPGRSAPVIPLQLASYSRPTHIDVDFDDKRPDFERLYYPGTSEPRRWHDAMSVVPMEAFDPSIEDELRQRVADSTKASDPSIARATVILTSFQFALDDREVIQGEFNAKYMNWASIKQQEDDEREARREADFEDRLSGKNEYQGFGECEEQESLASIILGEALKAGFLALFVDLPRSQIRKAAVKKRTIAERQTLPTSITEGKQTGLNCQIHATIIFFGRDGTEEQQSVRINRHAPLTGNGAFNKQTAALLEASLEEFSDSL